MKESYPTQDLSIGNNQILKILFKRTNEQISQKSPNK